MNAQPAIASIGHNSVSYGEMVAGDPALIYRDVEALPGLLAEIEADIAAHDPDLSSDKGRKAIASIAYGIARRKTAIDDAGKDLNEAARKQIETVDRVRRTVREKLDALRDKARAPLDKWAADEEVRKKRVTDTLAALDRAQLVSATAGVPDIDRTLGWLASVAITEADFGALVDRAEKARTDAIAILTQARARMVQAEAERAELVRLRAEQEERERVAREAEAKAQAEEAERQRIADATRRAEEAAHAEAQRNANEEREALERQHAAALKAEQDKAAEAERLRKEQEERIAHEKAEAEAAALRKAEDDRRRQADIEHRSAVMRRAKEALMADAGLTEEAARAAIKAIVAGSIPNIIIQF